MNVTPGTVEDLYNRRGRPSRLLPAAYGRQNAQCVWIAGMHMEGKRETILSVRRRLVLEALVLERCGTRAFGADHAGADRMFRRTGS